MANIVNFITGFVESAVYLLFELGKVTAYVMEVVGVRVRERIFGLVKLEEDFKGVVVLKMGYGVCV